MVTGITTDPIFSEHMTGRNHPENPDRMTAICRMIEHDDMSGRFSFIPAREAGEDELLLVHTPEHVAQVAATEGRDRVYLDNDTPTSSRSFMAAKYAAGGVIEGLEAVMAGKVDNCFSLVRPPGHHAEPARAMGFCLFNNVAIAAKYALERKGLSRVLIVDYDLHHGNGTQAAFYDVQEVMYISIHQYPHYPGTGSFDDVGAEKGIGYNINVPVPSGMGDWEYCEIFEKVFLPIARKYNPEFVLVSAGFDAHFRDPLGGMKLTDKGYAAISGKLVRLAEETCNGNILFVLEGGYHLASLSESVKDVLLAMLGINSDAEFPDSNRSEALERIVEIAYKVQRHFWDVI